MKNVKLKIKITGTIASILLVGLILPSVFPEQTYLFVPKIAQAAAPSVFSYQGRLTNAAGVLQNGSFDFRFSIWNNPTPPGGSQVWPGGPPSTVPLTVSDGVFNVNIGEAGYPDALNYDFNSTTDVYLQVEVFNTGTALWETLAPRQQITSSGYAINANTVGGHAAGTGSDDVLALDNLGAIAIAGNISTSGTLQGGSSLTSGTAALINTANTFNGNLIDLQVNGSSKLSVDQSGNILTTGNISGSASLVLSSGGTGTLTLKTFNQSAGSTNSANVIIASGNASGGTSNSGNISIDVGTATQSAGIVSIGTSNASALSLGRSGVFTAINGSLQIPGLSNANGVLYISDVSGTVTQTSTGGAGTLCLISTNGGAPTFGSCAGSASTVWSSLTNATANLSLNNGEFTTNLTFDTASTAAAFDGFTFSINNDATVDANTQRIVVIKNNSAVGGTTETLLQLDNADNSTVNTGIEIVGSSTGAITTAINVSDAEIGTALSIGANDITGTNFSVTGSNGNITSGTVNGQTLSAAASFTGTLAFTTLGSTDTTTVLCRNATNQLAGCNALTDAQISDTLTASNFVGSGSTTNAVDLATAEVNGTLSVGNGGTGAV
ncbi:MAG: hypothetical protein KW788_04255, partial [Candidatus Doudnabacteria bacterium]|nr:hypothetical protein [Candidatus Doudnabacteria bacterium]